MAERGEYRPIYTVLLDSPEFQRLSKDARLLLFALKMSLGPSGIDVLYDDQVAERAGLNRQELGEAREELVAGDWLQVEHRVHWLRNGLRYEPTTSLENKNHRTFVEKHIRGLPKVGVVNAFARYYGLDEPFPDVPSKAHSSRILQGVHGDQRGSRGPSDGIGDQGTSPPLQGSSHSVSIETGASAAVEKSEDDDWRALLAPAIRGIAFFCKDPPPGQTLRRNMSRAKQLIDAGYSPEMLVEAIKGARRMAARRVPPISGFIGPTDPFGVLIFDRDGEEGAKLIYTCASYYRSHADEEAPARSGTLERISA